MRGQMENRADYVAPLAIGDVMRAGGVGVIDASKNRELPVGALVGRITRHAGVQRHRRQIVAGARLPADTDPTVALGVLGGTGMTAYFGLLDLGEPKPGQTVVVSGAAGATGSMAGQIARIKGCRVVGLAGGAAKCAWLTDELGFDAAINYKSQDVGAALDAACPNGINIYFDNVGGEILDLCLARIAMNARVVICGASRATTHKGRSQDRATISIWYFAARGWRASSCSTTRSGFPRRADRCSSGSTAVR